jgi:hypothetical protein
LQARLRPDNAAGNFTSGGPEKIRAELHAITLSKRNSEDGKPRVITNLNRGKQTFGGSNLKPLAATMAPPDAIARKETSPAGRI